MISQHFDVVVMLTRSNWKTEPRSNRYHYATRFARELPVLFVQTTREPGRAIEIEPSEIQNIELVHAGKQLNSDDVDEFVAILRARGFVKPLVWIYNPEDYQFLIEGLPHGFRVFHATESYLTSDGLGAATARQVGGAVRKLLCYIDMLVGVSAGVVKAYQDNGGYAGPTAIIENGCDAEFFLKIAETHNQRFASSRNVAIYQGGMNRRVDFDLLLKLTALLPDWDFWFCGAADDDESGWRSLTKMPNIKYFGTLSPEEFGKLMCQATLGIIPFKQDPLMYLSLPLKAYEYVACSLPVVTTPIAALEREPDLFTTATTPGEFAVALNELATQRFDARKLERRREAAAANSYDARFSFLSAELIRQRIALGANAKSLNAALLYSEAETRISTIYEHIESFKKYSVHNFQFVPAVGKPHREEITDELDLSSYDFLIVHYCVRLSLPNYLSEVLAKKIEKFRGLKILFIQDEYEETETARNWMERLNFDIIYTCVPAESRERVYPSSRFPATAFLPTLTGYVPESSDVGMQIVPIADRPLYIAYRGRKLSYYYGELGQEKYRIGIDVRRLAEERGIPIDIEVDDSRRIYGADWFKFLGSARATLGTESGSNVFDFDGTIKTKIETIIRNKPDVSFEEVRNSVLKGVDGLIRMNQVSPKIFEAIQMRTALVLFEGSYSATVEPDLHYIPLKKDYSNIAEVFAKLADTKYLEEMTARAYIDVIQSGRYSYKSFVQSVDEDIAKRLFRGPAYQHFRATTMVRAPDGSVKSTLPSRAGGFAISTEILRGDFQRKQVADLIGENWKYTPPTGAYVPPTEIAVRAAGTRTGVAARFVLRAVTRLGESRSSPINVLRYFFRRMPTEFRKKIIRSLELINRSR